MKLIIDWIFRAGYDWWAESLLGYIGKGSLKNDDRPKLLNFKQSSNLAFQNLKLTNSPFFHLNLDGCANVTIDGLTVFVDTQRQQNLQNKHLSGIEWIKDKLLSHLPIFWDQFFNQELHVYWIWWCDCCKAIQNWLSIYKLHSKSLDGWCHGSLFYR